MRNEILSIGCVLAMVLLTVGTAQAAITIDTVAVGNPGNTADTHGAGYGAVGYTYNIGRSEVTAGQYTAFLNAVAATDSYGLYNASMWSNTYGCKIQQSGSSGGYTYSVASGYANRPVNYVSFWDACRFANWLHNGQQGAGTTESGAYTLTTTGMNNNTITRNTGAQWAVASEDEWYKAAYYDGTSGVYYDYPTGGNSISTTMANYSWSVGHTTDEGSYAYASPCGTFDQGGNVWEWNEAIIYVSSRGYRGGGFDYGSSGLQAANYDGIGDPLTEGYSLGFRVAAVPEPASMTLLGLGLAGLIARARRAEKR